MDSEPLLGVASSPKRDRPVPNSPQANKSPKVERPRLRLDSSDMQSPIEGRFDSTDSNRPSRDGFASPLKYIPFYSHKGTGTFFGTVANLVNSAVGAGMLAVPFAFQASGLALGTLILIFFTTLATFSMHIIGRAQKKTNARTYQEIVSNLLVRIAASRFRKFHRKSRRHAATPPPPPSPSPPSPPSPPKPAQPPQSPVQGKRLEMVRASSF
jgi:hypothetical protein